ncbi:helix-turn-helix domain-containing protein [Rhodoblastus acidophilus]|uniref:Helix-turn-helix domain-containing protein n=1 Tax=Candidatus Rhodoblastus alkanivorans TaxID=2954117 RepID=A0ABS9Z864_9HYPH|nr:helix-turn-helix domain-containing protein [Candidatus Rhodoblastus alkanivorans]MCI4677913.1 helix-turn-helix domain-containing protein [Candidatus Rhodoblastus alkanivorans]MCI4683809.1 helix-turn-helix domain-containing protein [Candidatus Rhodoblastus alkanivorans]MDI4641127.1 helix-turn-helix domain-containing protein [Rhodoblastus acidophilus]
METLAEKVLFDTVFGRAETSPRNFACAPKAAPGFGLECSDCEIKGLSVCESLEPDEFELLERIGRTLSFPAKATLFEQGREAPFVSNITSGALRLSKLLPDGRRQVVGFALPGDFLGLAMQPTQLFTADALTPVKICQFSRVGFSDLLDEKPRLTRAMMNMAAHELTLAQDQMVVLGRRTAEEKIASFLIGMRNRYARIHGASVHVPLPMTRLDIGDYLGLTVETVSRMITRMAREKLIVIVPDGVRLLDVPRLEQMAEM